MKVSHAARTDVGQVRDMNQDAYLVEGDLYGVADGMGGHLAGDVAAATAVEVITDRLREEESAEPEELIRSVEAANREIFDKAEGDADLHGMGTTCTLVSVVDDRAHVAHVGDSRAYLLRNGSLEQLTEDHTLVERMVREGRIERDEAADHPQRSVITRALGVEPEVEVDTLSMDLRSGDRILLCSDGLSSMVDDADIRRLLEVSDPDAAADALIGAANDAGGDDNITVVIVDLGERDGGGAAVPVREHTDPAPPPQSREALEESRGTSGRKGILKAVLAGVGILVVLAGITFVGTRLVLGNSYFVGVGDDGTVAIYRGTPEEILGFTIKEEEERTDLRAEDLPVTFRDGLRDGIKVDSLDEARDTVDNLRERSRDFRDQGGG